MTIGEIAEKLTLPESTLRYYEKRGLLQVARDAGGRRNYEEEDIAWILFIRRLKETGMPIEHIRQYAELRDRGDETMTERLGILRTHRDYVLAQKLRWEEYLRNLDDKISFYEKEIKAKGL